MDHSIADLRKDYAAQTLTEETMADNPFSQFSQWWRQAIDSQILEPNAMTLATASPDGMPAARIVLLKDFSPEGFVFYTNYQSFKGLQLEANPKACLVFFWKELERQVRITGLVEKTSAEESDAYFLSRPAKSRLGAWASPQSRVIESRDWLDHNFTEVDQRFGGEPSERPPHWGGYRVKPVIVEFWQGRPSRMHDRIQYSIENDGQWKRERLAP